MRAVDLGGREVLELPIGRRDGLLMLLVGERLGQGVYREVYAVKGRPEIVAKVEVTARTFANVMEWEVWQTVRDVTKIAHWFCPCIDIDQDGGVLLQQRTSPMPDEVWDKLEIPRFFTDIKQENWGMLDGRPVCHDYARHLLMERGMSSRAMRKVA